LLRERGERYERGGRASLVCWFSERGVSWFGERIERETQMEKKRK
jgi:hypothetical protein